MFADKTRNVYETLAEKCDKLMMENVKNAKKIGKNALSTDTGTELKNIASKFSKSDRVITMHGKKGRIHKIERPQR